MMHRASYKHSRRNQLFVVVLVVTIFGGPLLSSFGPGSHAQQDPNRQLVQTNAAQPTKGERRVALVIGNGAYTNAPPLKNPPNDARDMAATLKLLGFTVSSATDADQRTMKKLIRDFGQQLKGGGQGLFYYAGHGVQVRGRNYLIPANAEIMNETDVEDQAVDLNLVLGLMDEAQNGLNIVILDACRNNPFTRSFRSAGSGLAQVDAPTGTLIAYATSPGRVASDGQGRNGLYTSELLSQMQVTGIGVEEMFKRVRAGVQRQTSGQQVPWESSSLVGNFYFAANISATVTSTDANAGENRIALNSAAFELSYWETIKNSSNVEDFKAYLDKYPSGQFAQLAKNRINNLEASTRPPEEPKETIAKNSLEGTTWKGDSPSSDKHYEFTFLPNGAVLWNLKWNGDKSYKGTWKQTGNTISMDFRPWWTDPVEVTLGGEMMSGSWAKGQYKFTLTRSSSPVTQSMAASLLEGTIWRGASPGGDKKYEFQFLPGGLYRGKATVGKNVFPDAGTWKLVGNIVSIDSVIEGFPQKYHTEATISEDTMQGTSADGKYKFTMRKIQ